MIGCLGNGSQELYVLECTSRLVKEGKRNENVRLTGSSVLIPFNFDAWYWDVAAEMYDITLIAHALGDAAEKLIFWCFFCAVRGFREGTSVGRTRKDFVLLYIGGG